MKILQLVLFISLMVSCASKGELGTESNPIKVFFMPSVDAGLISEQADKIVNYLEQNTPYKYKMRIPNSYIAMVEAFGSKRVDVAAISTFGYVLAHEKYDAEAILKLIRYGNDKYKSQIIAKKTSGISTINDLKGKKFAFVDPSSVSGYMLPLKLFKNNGIELGETVFAQKHDNVVTMIYQGQVDAGATFYSPPHDGKIQDARRLVKTQFPDVEDQIGIIEFTEEIPNDPIIVRSDIPDEMKTVIKNAFLAFMKTDEGIKTMVELYGANGLNPTNDKEYDVVREMLRILEKDINEML